MAYLKMPVPKCLKNLFSLNWKIGMPYEQYNRPDCVASRRLFVLLLPLTFSPSTF